MGAIAVAQQAHQRDYRDTVGGNVQQLPLSLPAGGGQTRTTTLENCFAVSTNAEHGQALIQ